MDDKLDARDNYDEVEMDLGSDSGSPGNKIITLPKNYYYYICMDCFYLPFQDFLC